jgi:Ni,Fe-hydrogenase I cytochrome b subunit
MKSFARIHIIFAAILLVAIVSIVCLGTWLGHLHELPDSSHAQFYLWQPRVEAIYFSLKYGATIPWLLFAIYHLFVVITKKIQSDDEH